MTIRDPAFEAWRDRAADADILDVALRKPVSAKLKKRSREWIGPCPACGGDDRFAINPQKGVFNCRGAVGGGVITMVMHTCGVDYLAACEVITGELPPAGGSQVSQAELEEQEAKRQAQRERKLAERERENAQYRERAREGAYDIWKRGEGYEATSVEAYLRLRLGDPADLELPAALRLRCIEQLGYFEGEACVHRGPAMLAPILRNDGKFSGLHRTWIDLGRPKGKADVPQAKKTLGTTGNGHIELLGASDFPPNRLVIGEGIEKTLAVWCAERSRGEAATLYWTSIDLGNLGGKHAGTVAHPTVKDRGSRPKRVPGPLPDLSEPGIEVPEEVEEIVILGDTTSDRFLTECAIARAAARWGRRAVEPGGREPGAANQTRPGRVIKVAWPPPDMDFDDVLRGRGEVPIEDACKAILAAIEAAEPADAVSDRVGAGFKPAPTRATHGFDQQPNETKPRRQARQQSSSPADSGGAPPGEPSPPPSGAGGAGLSTQPSQGDRWTTATLALDEEEDLKDALTACAELDENDVDNGKRLRRYFGRELVMIAQAGLSVGAWLHWTGVHWEYESGHSGALIVAQQVGDLIALEVDWMISTPFERERIAMAEAAADELKGLPAAPPKGSRRKKADPHAARRAELVALVKKGASAQSALWARKIARREWGNASKNKAKITNMLDLAGPYVRRPPDAFNADPLLLATRTHTLRFVREADPECPDPDTVRFRARLESIAEHRRRDLLTAFVPCAYDPAAKGPRWEKFLARCMPNEQKLRTLRAFTGLGLTALPIQRLMFHYGTGANGKSVFLEVITRLLGDSFAVGLPVESVTGMTSGTGASASPDIARLFGKRMLRVHELPQGVGLKAEVIKKFTGGEKMTARELFKGFFEFQPRAKVHMSGNDPPRFDGSDGGMRRRLIYMEWTETIPESEQRDFEEFVSELLQEGPAILNWLIEGALDYLANGLFIAEEVRAFTQEQFDELDPVGQFVAAHVTFAEGKTVKAREMYLAFTAWCMANSIPPMKETRFGRIAKKKMTRDDSKRVHVYVGVELHDVPERPSDDGGRGGPRPGDDMVF